MSWKGIRPWLGARLLAPWHLLVRCFLAMQERRAQAEKFRSHVVELSKIGLDPRLMKGRYKRHKLFPGHSERRKSLIFHTLKRERKAGSMESALFQITCNSIQPVTGWIVWSTLRYDTTSGVIPPFHSPFLHISLPSSPSRQPTCYLPPPFQ